MDSVKMFRKSIAICCLCVLVLIVQCGSWSTVPRISHPNLDPPHLSEFPHIAAIGWKHNFEIRWVCGGSLIRENFILTAAHCASVEMNGSANVVRLGDINLYNDEDDEFVQQLKIVKIIRYPGHRFQTKYFDIALMKLERKVTITDGVAPVCLWVRDDIRFPQLLVAGWGSTGYGEPMSKTLLQGSLFPVSNSQCSEQYGKDSHGLADGLTEHQFCARANKTDTCPGDSGGPLEVKLVKGSKYIPFLVGVTSFGGPCGFGEPGVYVKVSKFIDWITGTIRHHDELPSPNMFEPMICAERYYDKRKYVSESYKTEFTTQTKSNNSVTFRWPEGILSMDDTCAGTLIELTVVLTLAECVYNERTRPTQVELVNGDVINIVEYIVHPLYNRSASPYRKNIAILMLKYPAMVKMASVWLENSVPDDELLVAGQSVPTQANGQGVLIQASPYLPSRCGLVQKHTELFLPGSLDDHFCFKTKHILIPNLCKLRKGNPIYKIYKNQLYVEAVTLYGRDFWLKEPAVGIRLNAHKEWLMSEQFFPEHCEYIHRKRGQCVLKKNCLVYHVRLLGKEQISLCKNSKFICCPIKAIQLSNKGEQNQGSLLCICICICICIYYYFLPLRF